MFDQEEEILYRKQQALDKARPTHCLAVLPQCVTVLPHFVAALQERRALDIAADVISKSVGTSNATLRSLETEVLPSPAAFVPLLLPPGGC